MTIQLLPALLPALLLALVLALVRTVKLVSTVKPDTNRGIIFRRRIETEGCIGSTRVPQQEPRPRTRRTNRHICRHVHQLENQLQSSAECSLFS
jgi:hypothetical protein